MSDIVKWGLLVAGALAVIALIVALPVTGFIDVSKVSEGIAGIVSICGSALHSARGFINNFLSPFGRSVLTGLMYYLLCRWLITLTIKFTIWVYHFIFK